MAAYRWEADTGDLSADLDGIDLVDEAPADVVVIGGAGVDFTHQQLNEAFRLILDGAAFVAMHRNMYWRTADGLELDTGAYVRALEEATGVEPVVLGKPSPDFFASAVAELDLAPERVAMIGDDIEIDVRGARRMGIQGWLVKTGRFRKEDLGRGIWPDHVLESIADLI